MFVRQCQEVYSGSQCKGNRDLFAPEGQRAGNKRVRPEREDEGGKEREQGRWGSSICLERDNGPPLDRDGRRGPRQMVVYKGKGAPVLGRRCLILI